jgi:hypothetical protein
MNKNIEELLAKKMVNLLFREFNVFQLNKGIRIPVKTFYSLLSYLRFGKKDVPFILDLLRKNDFTVMSSKNGIFIQCKVYTQVAKSI